MSNNSWNDEVGTNESNQMLTKRMIHTSQITIKEEHSIKNVKKCVKCQNQLIHDGRKKLTMKNK
jgi:hypothetical protein